MDVVANCGDLKNVDSTKVRYCTQVWNVSGLVLHRAARLFSIIVLSTLLLMVLAMAIESNPLIDFILLSTADVPSKMAEAPMG